MQIMNIFAEISYPINTDTLLTPKSLPIERNPNTSRYKCKACFFKKFDLAVDFISTV